MPMYFPRPDGGSFLSPMTGGGTVRALAVASATAAGDSTIVGAPSAPGIGRGGIGFVCVGVETGCAGFGETAGCVAEGSSGVATGAASVLPRGMTIVASDGAPVVDATGAGTRIVASASAAARSA